MEGIELLSAEYVMTLLMAHLWSYMYLTHRHCGFYIYDLSAQIEWSFFVLFWTLSGYDWLDL